ncbi:uncharacterized protein AB675_3643 [Cyphellophora attinorum]|uniref:Nudix hydrolase domain-containing protein n=1 Tax=Cyphellophora attinorum TaxID=1664694 RepID=A0A0N1HK36_9EURO|nr:uncharacterized protein AB675_3643 [Phialophora attinorum]KPI37043.1 hypothetical protein AB675_3643 [Phialophora attinorum]
MAPSKPSGAPKPKFEVREYTTKKDAVPPSPSASIILVSPSNQILLLHRVKSSSAFPSAHVFPGGNLDPQDGTLPSDPTDPERHKDSLAYRTGAIRELASATSLLPLSPEVRLEGRKAVHSGKISFKDWLAQQSKDAVLHTDGLTPFTHWVTPPNVPKRFTTQMYIYFVHLKETNNPSIHASADKIETMAPEYRPAHAWLSAAQSGEVILFPPQFLLLHLASGFLDARNPDTEAGAPVYGAKGTSGDDAGVDAAEIVRRRRELYQFITTDGSPPWSDKYISPIGKGTAKDGRSWLALDKPGPELKDSGLKGDESRVVMVKFAKEGPRQLDVRWASEVKEMVREGKL